MMNIIKVVADWLIDEEAKIIFEVPGKLKGIEAKIVVRIEDVKSVRDNIKSAPLLGLRWISTKVASERYKVPCSYVRAVCRTHDRICKKDARGWWQVNEDEFARFVEMRDRTRSGDV